MLYLVYRLVRWRRGRVEAAKTAAVGAQGAREGGARGHQPGGHAMGGGSFGMGVVGGTRRGYGFDSEGFCNECQSRPDILPPRYEGAAYGLAPPREAGVRGISSFGLELPGEAAQADALHGHFQ
jgi:hypothetical protein